MSFFSLLSNDDDHEDDDEEEEACCCCFHADEQLRRKGCKSTRERERERERKTTTQHFFYKKMGQIRPLYSLFSFFSQDKYSPNLTINDKSIDAVLGTRTRGCRIQHFVLLLANYGLLPHSKIALCKFWVNYPTLGLKLTDSRSRVFSPQPLCHGSRPCCTL